MRKLMFVFFIFIVGCSQLNADRFPFFQFEEEKKESVIGYGGSVVTKIEYPADEGSISLGSFSPKMVIANTGSTESSGNVCIAGLDKDNFRGFPGCDCESFDFQAFEGEKFEPLPLFFGPYSVQESGDAVFTAFTRYFYETRAVARICFVEDCTAGITERAEGPVKITAFQESYTPQSGETADIKLLFTLADLGNGVIHPANVNVPCNKVQTEKVVSIALEEVPLLGSVDCGDFLFDDRGEAKIVCDLGEVSVIDSSGRYIFEKGFQTTARVVAKYGYETRNSVRFSS